MINIWQHRLIHQSNSSLRCIIQHFNCAYVLGLPHHVKKYPSYYSNVILQGKTGFLLDFQGHGKTWKTSNPDFYKSSQFTPQKASCLAIFSHKSQPYSRRLKNCNNYTKIFNNLHKRKTNQQTHKTETPIPQLIIIISTNHSLVGPKYLGWLCTNIKNYMSAYLFTS